MRFVITTILFILSTLGVVVNAQDSLQDQLPVSHKYLDAVKKQSKNIAGSLDHKSQKYLDKFQKLESKLRSKLKTVDSVAASEVFGNAKEQYAALQEKLKGNLPLTKYIPELDSMNASLDFLTKNPQLLKISGELKGKLASASIIVKTLQSKMQGAEEIKKFLKERKLYLRQALEKFGFARQFKKLNKQVYYYSQQLNEYRAMLKDPKKAAKKAMAILSKTKLFQDFMRKNSLLARLFRLPGDPNDPTNASNLAGLQTRAQVNALIQQQIASGGPNAQTQFQQNVQAAQLQLNQLKAQLMRFGSGNSDDIMPEGFRKNDQKTKSFLKRLEYGTNIQSQRATNFFPVTSDIGLSLGYKLNDQSIIGIGASYKLGWGRDFRHINLSSQGLGLRSYIDIKLKGSFWISGGYEQNYKSAFRDFILLKDYSAWQKSGLLGISKVVSLKTKFFKKTKLQVLFDFLSHDQIPQTQPFIFRINYSLK